VPYAGDVNEIRIGENTNIQDGVIVHVARNNAAGTSLPTIIGSNVTIGKPHPAKSLITSCQMSADFKRKRAFQDRTPWRVGGGGTDARFIRTSLKPSSTLKVPVPQIKGLCMALVPCTCGEPANLQIYLSKQPKELDGWGICRAWSHSSCSHH
jgi:hypothetical protein